jgi:signal transduction histidine kinase
MPQAVIVAAAPRLGRQLSRAARSLSLCLNLRPARWTDEDWKEFRAEGHQTRIRWAGYAAGASALLYLLMFGVVHYFEMSTSSAQNYRLGLAAVLAAMSYVLLKHGDRVPHWAYLLLISSVMVKVGLVAVFAQGPNQQASISAINAAPGYIFALMVMYGFLNLPLWLSSSLGWGLAASMAWACARAGVESSEAVRAVSYVCWANLTGMVMSHLRNTQQAQEFDQRLRLNTMLENADNLKRQARDALEVKRRLIAAISHDLRQPVTAAIVHLEILKRRFAEPAPAPDSAQAVLRSSEGAVGAMRTLRTTLDHLLEAARAELGSTPVKPNLVFLGALLEESLATHGHDARKRDISMRIRISDRTPCAWSDRRVLNRILGNLVSNAIKFTPEGGGVLVTARSTGTSCRIDVYDTGIGIAAEELNRIWEPFVQLGAFSKETKGVKNRARGLGLGLHLVHEMLEPLACHHIRLRSVPGRGTHVTLRLPAIELGSVTAAPSRLPMSWPASRSEGWPMNRSTKASSDVCSPEAQPFKALSGTRILILEDDLEAREAMSMLLSGEGACVAALTGPASLGSWTEGVPGPDVLLTDLSLSDGYTGIEGIEIVRRASGYRVPAVMVTGHHSVNDLRADLPEDVVIVQKPFEPAELVKALVRMRALSQTVTAS